MSLLPEDASFEELVQECFLAHRGKGLMLSALDAELLAQWRAEGVPFEVVARGIRRAAEWAAQDAVPGQPALASLRSCKKMVMKEFRQHLDRVPGAGVSPSGAALGSTRAGPGIVQDAPQAEDFELSQHLDLREALERLGQQKPELGPVTSRLLLGILARPPRELAEVTRRGDVVSAALQRALPFPQRLALQQAVRRSAGDGLTSARARKVARRFARAQAVVERFALPALG